MRKPVQFVLGVMTGTSLDGLDAVLTKVSKDKIQLVDQAFSPFPKILRSRLLTATTHQCTVDELANLHHELGRFYKKAIQKLKANRGWTIDLVGLHGQTVFHAGKTATLQIGEPSYLSEALACPVIADFRVADLSLGGEGAPLAPFFHEQVLAKSFDVGAVHNLGGISNVTFVKNKKVLLAFDTGPANLPLDLNIQRHFAKLHFDQNGKLARQGQVSEKLVTQWLQHPYFKLKPPKSCGREEFGQSWLAKHANHLDRLTVADQMATLTEFVACSIALAYEYHAPKGLQAIYLCGGGAKNKFLLERLKQKITYPILTTAELGWPPSTIEGAAFALLAWWRWQGKQVDLQKTTGANRPGLLGKIVQV